VIHGSRTSILRRSAFVLNLARGYEDAVKPASSTQLNASAYHSDHEPSQSGTSSRSTSKRVGIYLLELQLRWDSLFRFSAEISLTSLGIAFAHQLLDFRRPCRYASSFPTICLTGIINLAILLSALSSHLQRILSKNPFDLLTTCIESLLSASPL
jgi:hypothetical protein